MDELTVTLQDKSNLRSFTVTLQVLFILGELRKSQWTLLKNVDRSQTKLDSGSYIEYFEL